ncbi:Metallo-dependent phosphatase [Auriscalpium vulgare]|uniref:Metallo-dependent phosphatase n=1 Tax=Auriscalpium vulgare TaxID=40419 RepID=A0ACB8RE17_9AGAM|nr:Metallo-dependent phosphatase [Auriscalpium vulgare]
MPQSYLRRAVSFSVLLFFLTLIFSMGVIQEISAGRLMVSVASQNGFPDFGQYVAPGSLSAERLSLDSPDRRVIIIGDIHGMSDALQSLLREVHYDSKKDTLIHVGDIAAKGPQSGSISVLSYMSMHNITGVRGNHDQKVLEWRAWIEWVRALGDGAGRAWLDGVEGRWLQEQRLTGPGKGDEFDADDWVEEQAKNSKKGDRRWWGRVPKGWKMFSDHYNIARAMTAEEYGYLRSLPLVLHLPSEHTFLVHAGLLPYDPTRSITSQRQPLARLPSLPAHGVSRPTIPSLREAQELAILDEVKQNADPWVVLNMRNILSDNTVSRKTKKGKAWAKTWNDVMPRCAGYDKPKKKGKSLPCYPSTVVYGHAAARGLDVHRWTIGLDSGCVRLPCALSREYILTAAHVR